VDQAKNTQGSVRERGEDLGQARPLGVVVIFAPPAVFDEVQAVFHLPVATDVRVECRRRDRARVEAAYEVSAVVEQESAIGRTHFTVGTDRDLTAGKVQTLADILGVVQVDPKPADFSLPPLFSATSWAGRVVAALAKHVFNASRTSGWFALT
jgi:hypothetical protein